MKVKAKFTAIILAAIICLSCFGCSNSARAIDAFYFNSDIHIETRNKPFDTSMEHEITGYLDYLDKAFSITQEDSIVSKYNNLKGGENVLLSDPLEIDVFKQVIAAQEFSDGKFNCAVYPLSELWGFKDGYPLPNFVPPTDDEINKILTSGATSIDTISYDALLTEQGELKKLNDSSKIDLGGILKGYAADGVGKMLNENGYNSGYVSIGTSSLYILSVESLKIRHPRNQAETPSVISVNLKGKKNLNVSTSGDYEKTYTFNGKTYCHIIDPVTGKPAETGVMSATLIGADGGFSDAITTALCLCKHTNGDGQSQLVTLMQKILSTIDITCQIFVLWSDGENNLLLTNKKQGEDFTLLDPNFTVVNI